MRLLCACWLSGDCSVPDDNQKLSSLSGLPEHELAFVREMFIKHPNKTEFLTNERLIKEWKKAKRVSSVRSQAGVQSGKSRRTHVPLLFEQNTNKNGTIAVKSDIIIHNSELRELREEGRDSVSTKPSPLSVEKLKQRREALEAFAVTDEIREWARKEFQVEIPSDTVEEFKDHWRNLPDKKLRTNWKATFQGRIRQLVSWGTLKHSFNAQPQKAVGHAKVVL